jgi:hypothetical protein
VNRYAAYSLGDAFVVRVEGPLVRLSARARPPHIGSLWEGVGEGGLEPPHPFGHRNLNGAWSFESPHYIVELPRTREFIRRLRLAIAATKFHPRTFVSNP